MSDGLMGIGQTTDKRWLLGLILVDVVSSAQRPAYHVSGLAGHAGQHVGVGVQDRLVLWSFFIALGLGVKAKRLRTQLLAVWPIGVRPNSKASASFSYDLSLSRWSWTIVVTMISSAAV